MNAASGLPILKRRSASHRTIFKLAAAPASSLDYEAQGHQGIFIGMPTSTSGISHSLSHSRDGYESQYSISAPELMARSQEKNFREIIR